MTAINFSHRVANIIGMRGPRLLSKITERTGVEVRGDIRTTSDPSRRYAYVHKDPDILFVEPGHDYEPLQPKYDIWVGENLRQSVGVLRAFDFTIAHEAIHVVDDVTTQGLKRIMRIPGDLRSPAEEEIIIDRAALEVFKRDRVLVSSMMAFSDLVITDYTEGGLKKLAVPNAARELAKLRWVEQEAEVPPELKDRAQRIAESYFKAMDEHVHGQLRNETVKYLKLFTLVKVEIS